MKAGRTVQEMKEKYDLKHPQPQLYMGIEFWYTPVGSNREVRNPRQPHYFDFNREIIIADF